MISSIKEMNTFSIIEQEMKLTCNQSHNSRIAKQF